MKESGLYEDDFIFYRSKKIVFKQKIDIFEKASWILENFPDEIEKNQWEFNEHLMQTTTEWV